jgi:hypothetical protein
VKLEDPLCIVGTVRDRGRCLGVPPRRHGCSVDFYYEVAIRQVGVKGKEVVQRE